MNKKGMTLVEVLASVAIISMVVIIYVQFNNLKNFSKEEINTMLELEYKMGAIIEEEYRKVKNNENYAKENIKEEREIEIKGKTYKLNYKTEKMTKEFQWKTDKVQMIKMELKANVTGKEVEVEAYVTKK